MKKKLRTIAVTGAAGFLGSHLCETLIKKNYKVIGIDDMSKGSVRNLDNIKDSMNFKFHKQSVLNLSRLSKLFLDADVIVHFAAAKIPRYGNRIDTLLTNTKGTENVLEVAKKNKAKIVFSSTSDVYGKNNNLPVDEQSNLVLGPPDVARWAYATSKIFDEHLIYAYMEQYKVPFVILRLFGVYGPRQHRSWWGGPQSLFIDAILTGKTVEIHGTGRQTRTLLYVDDAINALMKSIQSKRAIGNVINVGSVEEISMINFARKISKLVKKRLKIKRVNYQSFTGGKYEDIERKLPSVIKAKKILNWAPLTNLDSGLLKTIQWHRENPI